MVEPNANVVLDALAEYIYVLRDSASAASRAEDRDAYQRHLAAAAEMFESIRSRNSLDELNELIERERRSFGWAYLSGEPGARAEAAFTVFARRIQNGRANAT